MKIFGIAIGIAVGIIVYALIKNRFTPAPHVGLAKYFQLALLLITAAGFSTILVVQSRQSVGPNSFFWTTIVVAVVVSSSALLATGGSTRAIRIGSLFQGISALLIFAVAQAKLFTPVAGIDPWGHLFLIEGIESGRGILTTAIPYARSWPFSEMIPYTVTPAFHLLIGETAITSGLGSRVSWPIIPAMIFIPAITTSSIIFARKTGAGLAIFAPALLVLGSEPVLEVLSRNPVPIGMAAPLVVLAAAYILTELSARRIFVILMLMAGVAFAHMLAYLVLLAITAGLLIFPRVFSRVQRARVALILLTGIVGWFTIYMSGPGWHFSTALHAFVAIAQTGYEVAEASSKLLVPWHELLIARWGIISLLGAVGVGAVHSALNAEDRARRVYAFLVAIATALVASAFLIPRVGIHASRLWLVIAVLGAPYLLNLVKIVAAAAPRKSGKSVGTIFMMIVLMSFFSFSLFGTQSNFVHPIEPAMSQKVALDDSHEGLLRFVSQRVTSPVAGDFYLASRLHFLGVAPANISYVDGDYACRETMICLFRSDYENGRLFQLGDRFAPAYVTYDRSIHESAVPGTEFSNIYESEPQVSVLLPRHN